MSEIDKETVIALAQLARIELKPEEVATLTKNLAAILAYVEELKAVNTDGLPEISQVTGLKNIVREDIPMPIAPDIHERLLKAFPKNENGYLKVKAVFDNEE